MHEELDDNRIGSQILLHAPNMKFHKSPSGGIRAFKCGHTDESVCLSYFAAAAKTAPFSGATFVKRLTAMQPDASDPKHARHNLCCKHRFCKNRLSEVCWHKAPKLGVSA